MLHSTSAVLLSLLVCTGSKLVSGEPNARRSVLRGPAAAAQGVATVAGKVCRKGRRRMVGFTVGA